MKAFSSLAAEPVSDESFHKLITQLEKTAPLKTETRDQLQRSLTEATYKTGTHILNFGARQPSAWFLIDGLLQELSVDPLTYLTTTTWFWFPVTFIYATPGFFDRGPSSITINVVRDSKLCVLPYEDWKRLKDSYTDFEQLTEIIRSNNVTARKEHLNSLRSLSTMDRYRRLETRLNWLYPHIQLKHIAEYVGMSTDTLGKLRKRVLKYKNETEL